MTDATVPSARGARPPTAADVTWAGYSLAERDRRWKAVRANAARAELDCLFLPLCSDWRSFNLSLEQAHGMRADSRYLTQLERAAVVMPTDSRPPIVVVERDETNAWIPDPRPVGRGDPGGLWSAAMVEALLDAGMERARVGVVGLHNGRFTHARARTGVVDHGSYAAVRARLPNATFEDATDVVGQVRYVKSDEEVACLRRAAEIAGAGIEEMAQVARTGLPEAELYGRVMRRLLELGSEYYPLALNAGPMSAGRYRHEDPYPGRSLAAGWLIENDVDAVWGGLIAQETQPILLGPVPEALKPLVELHREVFYAALQYMTPGRPLGDLIDYVNGFGDRRGLKTLIHLHGRGYGDDGPALSPTERGESVRDLRLERGSAFAFKPTAHSADDERYFGWGASILVTDSGGVQLVERTPDLLSIQ